MELNPEYITPTYPVRIRIALHQLEFDDGEKRLATSLADNLQEMENQAAALVGALALFQFAHTMPVPAVPQTYKLPPIVWMLLAMRQGALAISNFLKSLEAAKRLFALCPSIADLVDAKAIKKAAKEYRDRFPRAERLRDAVSHPELYANPDAAMEGPGMQTAPGIYLSPGKCSGTMHNETFVVTIQGETISYDLTLATIEFVLDITRRAFAAFGAINNEAIVQQRALNQNTHQ